MLVVIWIWHVRRRIISRSNAKISHA
jgi:hypothetical protein